MHVSAQMLDEYGDAIGLYTQGREEILVQNLVHRALTQLFVLPKLPKYVSLVLA
jgi:hypothetical protein